jgi:peptidoglycan hydrolase CwlO-like protein
MNDTSDNEAIQAKVASSENIDRLFQIFDDSAKSLDDSSDTAMVTKLVCDVVKLKQKQVTTEKHLVNMDENMDSLEGDHVKLRNENKELCKLVDTLHEENKEELHKLDYGLCEENKEELCKHVYVLREENKEELRKHVYALLKKTKNSASLSIHSVKKTKKNSASTSMRS